MSLFLSHLHSELRQSLQTKRGAAHPRNQAPIGQHKTYPRLPRLELPEPEDISVKLSDALKARISQFRGESGPLSLQDIATLLGLAVRKQQESARRHYPSDGAVYPIETYLISNKLEGQKPAAYHYNPTAHALEQLYELPPQFDMKTLTISQDADMDISTLIIFTSIWQRSSTKYGELAYTLALLEAGHMSENILLVGCASLLGVLPYRDFSDTAITEILDLDVDVEQAVHSIIVRKEVA